MLTEILVPIFVCVVLPVAIVWIVFYSITTKNNNETSVILEAIKSNPKLNTEKLINSFRNSRQTPMQTLMRKLLRGLIYTLMAIAFAFLAAFCPDEDFMFANWFFCGILGAIGVGFLITYWFAYKNFDKIEKEFSAEKTDD